MGGNLSRNRYFDPHAYPFYSTSCGSISSKNPLKILKAFFKITKGLWQSHRAIKSFRPDLAIGFGSYYTFPTLVSALFNKIPVVLHEANSIPGKVNRLLSRYALVTGIHFPETAALIHGPSAVVGMPLRNGFKKGSVSPEEAKAYFHLQTDKPILLVFGGSQGAQALNLAVSEALAHLGNSLQVIHITGPGGAAKIVRYRYREGHVSACVKEFETRMDMAWQAADFMISRAGAGTISEAIEFEVPGILVPWPHAADNHQERNADFMVSTVGGAEKITERNLTSQGLIRTIESWLAQNGSKLKALREKIAAYKKEGLKTDMGALVQNILNKL